MSTQADKTAETYAKVTGSVGATYRVERRNADGTLTVLDDGSFGTVADPVTVKQAEELARVLRRRRYLRAELAEAHAEIAELRAKVATDPVVIEALMDEAKSERAIARQIRSV